jgi:VWFA-related protein
MNGTATLRPLAWLALAAACVGAVPVGGVGGHAAPAPRGGQATFRSGVALVRVDVLASDKGRPVTGLQADDFEVLDNGVVQRPEFVTAAGGITVVAALDTSQSVNGRALDDLVSATRALVGGLKPGDLTGLITFSQRVSLRVPVTARDPGAALVDAALDALRADGGTAVRDAVFAGLTLAARDVGRSLLLVFTDGADSASWLSQRALEESVSRSEVVVYVVVSGTNPDAAFLQKIADISGGQLFRAGSSQLTEHFGRILEEFRQRYVLAYEPQNVRRDDGWHTLKVRLKSKAGSVKARAGYFAAGK